MANNLSEVRSKITELLRNLSDEDLIAYAEELGIEVPVDAGELACEKTPTITIDNHEPVDVLQYEREVTQYK